MSKVPIGGDNFDTEIDFTVSSADEPFRLLKGFRDFFIAIGIIILAVGLSMLAQNSFELVFDSNTNWYDTSQSLFVETAINLALVAIAIAISEWVTKSQRLPLSSLVLTLVFTFWASLLVGIIYYGLAKKLGFGAVSSAKELTTISIVSTIGAIIALVFYYIRYRLPFVLLPIAGVAVFAVWLLFNQFFELDASPIFTRVIIGVCGIGVFIMAMWFDMKDRLRVTRLSECAFWLHLLAAPLIVHSILFDNFQGNRSAITILLAILVLAIFALIIDRRAMLVSALTYLGYSLFKLIKDLSFFGEFNNSISLVILGAMVLGLGLGWSQIRKFFVGHLVWRSLREKLPPVIE